MQQCNIEQLTHLSRNTRAVSTSWTFGSAAKDMWSVVFIYLFIYLNTEILYTILLHNHQTIALSLFSN